jgi:DNA-directed RNA polymerase subunit RPC12/RpoP
MEILIVGIVVFIILYAIFSGKGDKIRCQRCGFRAYEKEYNGQRCPSCGSLEL